MQAINSDYPFYLFSNCIFTKGATRSIIIDTDRKKMEFIPNALEHILNFHEGKTISQIKEYSNVNPVILDEYFNFLIKNEFIYFSKDPYWKKVNEKKISHILLDDIVIEYSFDIKTHFKSLLDQVSKLYCQGMLIIFEDNIELEELLNVFNQISKSSIEHLEIYLKFSEDKVNLYNDWFRKFPFLQQIIFNESDLEKIEIIDHSTNKLVIFSPYHFDSSNCGKMASFNYNLKHIQISKRFNSCLFGKIAIDKNGYIKSCLSIDEKFGNIKSNKIANILSNKNYIGKFSIKKSDINTCKDCEFRDICTDCRTFTRSDNIFGKPKACSYNPYINKWLGEEGFYDEDVLTQNEINAIINNNSFELSSY
jgi:SPASM domain peptide maturase of grasp-with-spasm system